MSGMLDAIEALDEETGREAIDLGLGLPRGSVRMLALELRAQRDPKAARTRAASDPDGKVRSWTSTRRPPRRGSASVGGESRRQAGNGGRRHPESHEEPATLFET